MADFLKKNTVPILLFTVLCSSVAYIYARSDLFVVLLFTVFGTAYAAALFALYEMLRKKNKAVLSAGVTVLTLALSCALGSCLFETGFSVTVQWVLEPNNFGQIFAGNIAALLLTGGAVLCSALYYFTAVRFRSVFVFLICMCPFSLFAKTFTDIPVIYIILAATLFFILMILQGSGGSVISEKRGYAAFGLFVTAVASAAAFLPKLESAPYREAFDELITGIQIGGASAMDFNNFSDTSSYSTSDDDEKVLFTIYGDNPVRIKRQCFNLYDPKTGQWGYYGESDTGYNSWSSYLNWEDPASLAAECGMEAERETRASWIRSEGGKLRALYTPENMTGLSLSEGSLRNVYRTPMDEYFVSSDNPEIRDYKIVWCEPSFDDAFSAAYTDKTAGEYAEGASGGGYYKALTERNELYSELMRDSARRSCFGSDADYRRVRELAASLTQNCASGYEKARAIEAYLLSPQFVYDDDFSPADASVENFLFHTKRGVCSDYATAMALLCREAGLYSRYVEGFLIPEGDSTGSYAVTAADSHAYVQVWLDGYGWTDFDPTSRNTDGGYVDYTFFLFGGIVLLLGAGTAAVLLLRPAVKKRLFLRRAGRLRGARQAEALFPELNRILHKKLGKKQLVYTVRELKEQTALAYGVDISALADDYERAAYGGIETDARDYRKTYCEILRLVKESEKSRKKAERSSKRK